MLLLEAGPDYPTLEGLPADIRNGQAEGDVIPSGHLWDLAAKFERSQEARLLARGKVVGGSSAVNGQVFLRGIPEDFSEWVNHGATDWSFESLLPYFRRVENDADFRDGWHGSEGPVPVRRYQPGEWLPPQSAFFDACEAAGFPVSPDANHPEATGISPIPFNNLGGVRQSAALTHLAAARRRPNLEIRADTQATRIRLDRCRVQGVEVRRDRNLERYEARHVVLAAGVIGTPRLLMLSGIGPAQDLERLSIATEVDLPGVGQNLQDHQVVDLAWTGADGAWTPPPRAPLLQVALTYSSHPSRRNDMKITARSRLMAGGRSETDRPVLTLVPGVYLPASSGRLKLASADPTIRPLIEFDFLTEELDRARLREGVRRALELSRHPALGQWTAERTSPDAAALASESALDGWIRSAVRSSQHACGTCRIGGDGDMLAVVDPEGRVRGVEGLSVVDASVFPVIVRAHLNATVLTVAERMADLIRTRR